MEEEDSHYTDLLNELECPICTNYMSPPIPQCATGHSICEDCRRKLSKCALCKAVFTDSRNISLERLARKVRFPCINRNYGCNVKIAFNERKMHETICSFKGYKCAMEKCPWVGRLENISQHWASKKMTSRPYRENNICHTKMKLESYYVNIVEAYNQLFWFKCKLSNKKMSWAVQFIGKSLDAGNYCYEIEIFKPYFYKRKILLGDYCQTADIEDSLLFGCKCVCLPLDLIEPFLSNDQICTYNMRVYIVKNSESENKCRSPSVSVQTDISKGAQNKNKNKRS